jgi:hypothetical protein
METHHHKDIEIATPLNSTSYRLVNNELPQLKQAYTTPSSRTALLN